MADNSENTVWNTNHIGTRVPINDTGVDGAPVALFSNDPAWEDGSLNKAVKSTFLLTDTFPAEVVDIFNAGTADLRLLGQYLNKEMLYGFNGDAQNKQPGDMMAYRGYPTPIILSSILTLVSGGTINGVDLQGNAVLTADEWLTLSYSCSLKYPLPYNVEFSIEIHRNGVLGISLDIRIVKGSTIANFAKISGTSTWLVLPQNKAFYSFVSDTYSGDLTITTLLANFTQEPYYGVITTPELIIPQSYYRPTVLPIAYSVGVSYKNPRIWDISEILNNCSEISEIDLFKGNNGVLTPMYLLNGDTFAVGKSVYSNPEGTNLLGSGMYVTAHYVYTSEGTPIYRITRIISINTSGVISQVYLNIDAGDAFCFIVP